MLDNMPASKTRSLEGICPAHESCSRSFDDISNVLDSLKVYPGFRNLVSPDDVKCLSKAIVDAKIYIKNIYMHEIKNHSEIKVRLSCYLRFSFPPKNMLYQSQAFPLDADELLLSSVGELVSLQVTGCIESLVALGAYKLLLSCVQEPVSLQVT